MMSIYFVLTCTYTAIQKASMNNKLKRPAESTKNQRMKHLFFLSFSRHSTLWRKSLRESPAISAIVVDHAVPLHPSHPLLALQIHLVLHPRSSSACAGHLSRRAPRLSGDEDAGVSFEVTVRGDEGSVRPVCLDETAPCSPVVGVPQA